MAILNNTTIKDHIYAKELYNLITEHFNFENTSLNDEFINSITSGSQKFLADGLTIDSVSMQHSVIYRNFYQSPYAKFAIIIALPNSRLRFSMSDTIPTVRSVCICNDAFYFSWNLYVYGTKSVSSNSYISVIRESNAALGSSPSAIMITFK